MYGVCHCFGAWDESMIANVKRTRPMTVRIAPSQSILHLFDEDCFSWISDGMVRYAVIVVVAARMQPIQKYQPQVVYSAVTPAKKMPTKNLLHPSSRYDSHFHHWHNYLERSNNSFIAHGAKPIVTVVEVRLQ